MARIEQIILHGKKGTKMQIDVGTRVLMLEAETPEELGKCLCPLQRSSKIVYGFRLERCNVCQRSGEWLGHLQPLLPKRQGPLKKLKERQGFFRIKTGGYISSDWNHRFFVLQDKFLFYYDACGRKYRGSVFKGLIPLR